MENDRTMNDEAFARLSKDQLDQIDATCDLFEEDRGAESPPAIEAYLAAADEEIRERLLRELLDIELRLLRDAGKTARVAEYRSRFRQFAAVVQHAFEDWNGQPADNATRITADDDTDPFTPKHARVVEEQEVTGASMALPREFGRYRLLKLLGRGGMGTVYLAHDTQLDRQVALKIPDFAGHPEATQQMIERFYREARAIATVYHPNLCQIYDVGEHDGHPYLTMTYIDGQPLSELVEDDRPLAADEAVCIVNTLALAIEAVHQAGNHPPRFEAGQRNGRSTSAIIYHGFWIGVAGSSD